MDKQTTDFRRSLQLDRETDKLLQRLANSFDGNLSMAARKAIRNEATRAGLVQPVVNNQTWREENRHG